MSAKDIADRVRSAKSLAEVTAIGRGLTTEQADAVVRELESQIADITKPGATR